MPEIDYSKRKDALDIQDGARCPDCGNRLKYTGSICGDDGIVMAYMDRLECWTCQRDFWYLWAGPDAPIVYSSSDNNWPWNAGNKRSEF